MQKIPLPYADTTGNEEKYVTDTIRSSWLSSGAYVKRFEKIFAECCETRSTVTVCDGTSALHLALLALNVRAGDEVLVRSLTCGERYLQKQYL